MIWGVDPSGVTPSSIPATLHTPHLIARHAEALATAGCCVPTNSLTVINNVLDAN